MPLYQTKKTLKRVLRVHYPAGRGCMVMRTDLDWDRDVEPVSVSKDGNTSTFRIEAKRPFVYFKPRLVTPGGQASWAIGPNMLAMMTTETVADVYQYFEGSDRGSFSKEIRIDSKIVNRQHVVRAYLPAGYDENP